MSANVIRWCLLPTDCCRCRRILWLVRAVERLVRVPQVPGCPDFYERYCLVCVALESK